MSVENYTVNGLVIKETKYGEGNKILTVLTDKLGKIQVSASGVRSYKSKISSGCGMYCYSKFLLKQGRGMYNIVAADSICNFYNLCNDYEKLAYAVYFSELVCNVTVEDEAFEILRLMLNAMYCLENDFDLKLIKPVFELRLMKECGFMPNVFGCSECGQSQHLVYFSVDEGVSLCTKCVSKHNLTDSVISAMQYILTADIKKIFSFNIDEQGLNILGEIAEKYLISQICSVPKSLVYLKTNL